MPDNTIPAYMNNNINTVHNDFTKNIKRKILTFSVLITFCHHLNDGIFCRGRVNGRHASTVTRTSNFHKIQASPPLISASKILSGFILKQDLINFAAVMIEPESLPDSEG